MNIVRQQRKKRGWSQDLLAQVSKLGKRTIQRIETGKVQPSPETALSLASVLDIDPALILNHSGTRQRLRSYVAAWQNRPATPEELKALPESLRLLTIEYQRGLARYLDDQKTVRDLTQNASELHTQWRVLADRQAEGSKDLFAYCINDPSRALELIALARKGHEEMDHLSARTHSIYKEIVAINIRMSELSMELFPLAARIDKELDAYGVYDN